VAKVIENHNPPSLKANRGNRFFNAGDRLSEPLAYTMPGGADIHCIAKFMIDAPENSFFYVPTELKLAADNTRVPVDFSTTITEKFGKRGVILLDEDFEEDDENGQTLTIPVAKDDESARIKGKQLWEEYLDDICRKHHEDCQRVRAQGGFPREADGFTKRALKLRGWDDPAATVRQEIKGQPNVSPDVASLVEANRQLMAKLDKSNADNDVMREEIRQEKTAQAVAKAAAKKEVKKA
jgi:hypothetical protein